MEREDEGTFLPKRKTQRNAPRSRKDAQGEDDFMDKDIMDSLTPEMRRRVNANIKNIDTKKKRKKQAGDSDNSDEEAKVSTKRQSRANTMLMPKKNLNLYSNIQKRL